jgi:hypothetical protein
VRRQAYQSYRHVAAVLSGARLLGPLTGQGTGIEGYRFASGARTITVLWSDSEQIAVIPAQPGADVSCTDRGGEPVACVNADGAIQLVARSGPVFVVER